MNNTHSFAFVSSQEKLTPLHLATYSEEFDVARLLLENGAAVDPINEVHLISLQVSIFSFERSFGVDLLTSEARNTPFVLDKQLQCLTSRIPPFVS